jgi:UDP-N-acetylmuramyl pentapeptide phosphotransferase/UDP-N-acetylglucosamine-1-phosphate transferase
MAAMNSELLAFWGPRAAAILTGAALVSTLLIVALRPLLLHYAMARPNARSSHKLPTLQGGGIAVIAATLIVAYAVFYLLHIGPGHGLRLPVISAAVILIGCVGALADIHPDNVAPRLLAQALAVAAVIFALPAELRVMPILPWWIERVLLVVGGLWFVNLVNFMDGLDWMTVAEIVPITAALAAIGLLGTLPIQAVVVSLALCGAVIGFAWFNRPVAKLFLGDVGSLPIGLLTGWLLLLVAGSGGRAAAILLPLYYLADSTITLVRRAFNGEPVWQAHRTHFYQRATDRGLSVIEVVTRVFLVNLLLAALAFATVLKPSRELDIAALIAGAVLVAWLLIGFARGRR